MRPHQLVGPLLVARDYGFQDQTVFTKGNLNAAGLMKGISSIYMDTPPNRTTLLDQVRVVGTRIEGLVEQAIGCIVCLNVPGLRGWTGAFAHGSQFGPLVRLHPPCGKSGTKPLEGGQHLPHRNHLLDCQ